MAESTLDGRNPIPSATGSAGPIPRTVHCTPQCYKEGKSELSGSCKCEVCHGRAHGRGWNFAFEHGYLNSLPPGFQKPPPDQEWLPFEEAPTPIGDIDQP